MTKLTNGGEGGTSGTTVTQGGGGNSGGNSGNFFDTVNIGTGATLTFDNAHAAHGSLAYKFVTGVTAALDWLQWDTSLGSGLSQVWWRGYIYLTANPASGLGIARWLTASGGSQCARLAINNSGKLIFNDGANTTQLTSTASVPLNQWFRVEAFCIGSATVGQLEFKLFSTMDSTTPTETQTSGSALNTTGTIGALGQGIVGGTIASETYWGDDYGVSTTGYLGPANVTPLGTPYLIGKNSFASGSSSTTLSGGAVTGAAATGDAIFIVVATGSNTVTPSPPTDSKGNTYTLIGSVVGNSQCSYVFAAFNVTATTTGDTYTVTWSATSNVKHVMAIGCSGVASTGQPDINVSAQGSSAAPSVTSAALAQASELAIAVVSAANAATSVTWPSAWTAEPTLHTGSSLYTSVAVQDTTTTSALTAAATLGASAAWSVLLITFKGGSVLSGPSVTTSSLPGGTVGSPYSATLAAAGGTPPYTWAVTAGSLPPGLSMSTGSGGGSSSAVTHVAGNGGPDGQSGQTFAQMVDCQNTIGPLTGIKIFYNQDLPADWTGPTSSGLSPSQIHAAYPNTVIIIAWNGPGGGITPSTASTITNFCNSIPKGVQVGFAWQQEAENPKSGITATQFVAGFQATATTIHALGRPELFTVVCSAWGQYMPLGDAVTGNFLPGPAFVDVYAMDLYQHENPTGSFNGAPTWPSQGLANHAGFQQWLSLVLPHGKPLALTEYGIDNTQESVNPGMRAARLQQDINYILNGWGPGGTISAIPFFFHLYWWHNMAAANEQYKFTDAASEAIWQGYANSSSSSGGSSTGGVISGTPTTAGTYNFTVQVTDSAGLTATAALSIVISGATITVTSTLLPGGSVGAAYTMTLAATGGTAPYTWAVTVGTLPAGLALDAAAGIISGTPTTPGTSNFTIQATDQSASSGTAAVSIVISAGVSVTTSSLPGGTVGTGYSQALAATGGTSPYTWSIIAGSLPTGLSLSSDGTISGTPSVAGTFSFTVQATDTTGSAGTAALSIVIAAATATSQALPVVAITAQFTPGVLTDITAYVRAFNVTRQPTREQGPIWTYQPGTCTVILKNDTGRFDPDNLAGPYVAVNPTRQLTLTGQGNWTAPAQITGTMRVQCWADGNDGSAGVSGGTTTGGGSGSGGSGAGPALVGGGGGGGGEYAEEPTLAVSPGQVFSFLQGFGDTIFGPVFAHQGTAGSGITGGKGGTGSTATIHHDGGDGGKGAPGTSPGAGGGSSGGSGAAGKKGTATAGGPAVAGGGPGGDGGQPYKKGKTPVSGPGGGGGGAGTGGFPGGSGAGGGILLTYTLAGTFTQVLPGVPIQVTATWAGRTYNLFTGTADSWQDNGINNPRYTEVTLSATDGQKQLNNITLPAGAAVGGSEDTGARISRILDAAGWPASARNIDTGDSALQATAFGDTAWNLMQIAAISEGGDLFISGGGNVVFRRRRAAIEDTRSITAQAVFGDSLATGAHWLNGDDSTFEGGVGHWVVDTNCTIASSAAQAHSGSRSLAITSVAAGNAAANSGVAKGIVEPGNIVPVLGWFRANTTGRTCELLVNWFRADLSFITTTSVASVTDNSSGWTLAAGAVTAPAQAAFAQAIARIDSTGAGGELHFFDDGDGVVSAELVYAGETRANDDTTLANDIQATRVGGQLQELTDQTSVAAFGGIPKTYARSDLILQDDPTVLQWAGWVLYISSASEDRFDTLIIAPRRDPANLYPQALGRINGDRITARRRPAGVSVVSKDVFIKGVQHDVDFSAQTWITTWTLQSASKYGSFFTIGDPVLGAIGGYPLAW